MDLGLKKKIALVTGSTAGIGLAIAKQLAAEGAIVWINGRTQARVDAAVKEVGGNAKGFAADLGTAEGTNALIDVLPKVDVLVNNLGIFEVKAFFDITDDDWVRFFQTNVMSGIRLSRHYLPAMLAKKWGRIVFVSSESALQIPSEMVHYGMTKTAQIAVARGIAESFPASGVTVNSVLAGPTESEGVGAFLEQMASQQKIDKQQVEKNFFEHARPSSLLKRFASTGEIASMVTYLCSEAASATTGSALRVDGGVIRAAV